MTRRWRREPDCEAGGSPAAGHFPCAAKESNQRKAAPGVAPRIHGVPLCCLPRCGDCATRPGEAHTTRLTAGLEQCSSTSPHRVEQLGAPQGEKSKSVRAEPGLTRVTQLLPTGILYSTFLPLINTKPSFFNLSIRAFTASADVSLPRKVDKCRSSAKTVVGLLCG
jgi:hypothetical protein